jgi:hypothetical protein
MTTPADFINVSVVSSSVVNSAVANYAVQLTQISPMAASSKLDIVFPSEITPQANVLCIYISLSTVLTCTVNSHTVSITLPASTIASNAAFAILI